MAFPIGHQIVGKNSTTVECNSVNQAKAKTLWLFASSLVLSRQKSFGFSLAFNE